MRAFRAFYYGNSCLKKPIIFCLLCLLSSCGLFSFGPMNPKSENVRINFSQPNWEETDPNGSDVTFRENKTGKFLSFNSLCRRTMSSLDVLAQNIYLGISDLKILKKKKVIFNGVDAIESSAKGKIENKNVYILALTFFRNSCTFDVLFVNSHNFTDQDHQTYQKFLNSISFIDEGS